MAGFTIPKGNNGGKSSPPLSYCREGGCADRLFCAIWQTILNRENYFLTGNVIRKCSSGIQLNSGIVYKVGAGAGDQGYHREDHIHHTILPSM
ncbi:ADQ_G0006500.mRNA.1.CDS.1 [Saccharomyces cerevisiae]|nr:ADQ_G0006500.mRNA.1.CDS.1 [Saccharomyces cerevisiae]CAI6525936.1 ADQ_G0006500.mRNA.1.CDS.1 [Saccharomyces cerevisiae]